MRASLPAEKETAVSVGSASEGVATAGVPVVDDPRIEQAKGILAVMFAITPQEASLLMRAFAGHEFPTLGELAGHVVSVATEPPGVDVDLVRERLTLLLFADGAQL